MHTSRKLINNQDFWVMAVVRRGAAPPPSSSESSSDEEDAFTAISRGAKKKNKKKGLDSRGGAKAMAAALWLPLPRRWGHRPTRRLTAATTTFRPNGRLKWRHCCKS